MILILDILVIHFVRLDAIRQVSRPKKGEELGLELLGEIGYGGSGFRAQEEDLTKMGFGACMCLA